ncbi:MAG: hypothetical protein RBS36_09440 [Thiomicrospira sp.]|jgi:hypothetical protein|nr:hypothetical protein [Thiomicrospira sp.]
MNRTFIISALSLSALGAHAQGETHNAPQSADDPVELNLNFDVEAIQQNLQWLGQYVDTLSHSVDNYFAAEQRVPNGKARIKLEIKNLYSKQNNLSMQVGFDLRVNLPKTEEKFNLYVESFSAPDESERQGSAQAQASATQENSIGLGSLYRLSDQLGLKARAGLRFKGAEPNPFFRTGLRYDYDLGPQTRLAFEPEWIWYRIEGAALRGQLDIGHQLTPRHYLKATSYAFKYNKDQAWTLSQSVEWHYDYSDPLKINTSTGRQWSYDHHALISDTYIQTAWRYRLHDDWLFIKATPGVSWPRSFDYRTNPYIVIGLEAYSHPF